LALSTFKDNAIKVDNAKKTKIIWCFLHFKVVESELRVVVRIIPNITNISNQNILSHPSRMIGYGLNMFSVYRTTAMLVGQGSDRIRFRSVLTICVFIIWFGFYVCKA